VTFRRLATLSWVLAMALPGLALAQESALGELRAAAKQSPNDLNAQIALGRGLIEAGRLPEAEAQMKTVVRLTQGSVEGLYEAMRVTFATDDYRKSRAGCRDLVKKDEKHALSQVCMARAFLVWRRASRAFEYIDKALAADPSNYEAQLADADAKRMQGDFAAALAGYQRVAVLFLERAVELVGGGAIDRPADSLVLGRRLHPQHGVEVVVGGGGRGRDFFGPRGRGRNRRVEVLAGRPTDELPQSSESRRSGSAAAAAIRARYRAPSHSIVDASKSSVLYSTTPRISAPPAQR